MKTYLASVALVWLILHWLSLHPAVPVAALVVELLVLAFIGRRIMRAAGIRIPRPWKWEPWTP